MNNFRSAGFTLRLSTPRDNMGETWFRNTLSEAVSLGFDLARAFDLGDWAGTITISESNLEVADGKLVSHTEVILLTANSGGGKGLLVAFHDAVQTVPQVAL